MEQMTMQEGLSKQDIKKRLDGFKMKLANVIGEVNELRAMSQKLKCGERTLPSNVAKSETWLPLDVVLNKTVFNWKIQGFELHPCYDRSSLHAAESSDTLEILKDDKNIEQSISPLQRLIVYISLCEELLGDPELHHFACDIKKHALEFLKPRIEFDAAHGGKLLNSLELVSKMKASMEELRKKSDAIGRMDAKCVSMGEVCELEDILSELKSDFDQLKVSEAPLYANWKSLVMVAAICRDVIQSKRKELQERVDLKEMEVERLRLEFKELAALFNNAPNDKFN